MKTTAASIFTASTLVLTSCAEQRSPEALEQATTQTSEQQHQTNKPLPLWQPIVGGLPDLTESGQQELASYYASIQSPEDNPGVWSITGNDCSWYCGGEMQNVTASSTLPDQATFTYNANNAHDLGYDTAWVEGAEGPGIGEALTYTFTNKCPRITDIHIHNGYIKDEATWLKNNRVKTLELAINGKPIAKLNLSDTRAEQSFDLNKLGIGPLGRRDDGKPLTLTFKILEVYPGTTYDDTAISEIFFDGIDVH